MVCSAATITLPRSSGRRTRCPIFSPGSGSTIGARVPDGIAQISAAGNYSSKNVYSVGMKLVHLADRTGHRRVYTTTKTERVLKLQVGYDYIDQEQYAAARHQINAVVTYTF